MTSAGIVGNVFATFQSVAMQGMRLAICTNEQNRKPLVVSTWIMYRGVDKLDEAGNTQMHIVGGHA